METIEINQTSEKIYKDVLAKGLTVYFYPNKNVNSYYLSLFTKFGGKYNKFKFKGEDEICEIPFGLAHFLEHLSFHMDGEEVSDLFAPYGATINAFTSSERTNYIVYNTNYFKECLDTLLYYVYTPYYTDETVENERGIIKEEAKRCMDNPGRQLFFLNVRAFYKNSNYRHEVEGTLDEIDSITSKNINDAYKYFYHPKNMTLVVSGNFDMDEAMKVINDRMDKFTFPEYKEVEAIFPEEPKEVNQEYVEEELNINNDRVNISIKVPVEAVKKTGLSLYEYIVYANLIMDANFDETSDYYRELLDKNIVNNASGTDADKDDEYISLNVGNSPNKDMVKDFIDVTNKYYKNIKIDMDVINRKIKRNISNFIIGFDDPRRINNSIVYQLVAYGKINNDYMDIIKNFDVEKGQKVLDSIDFDNKTTIVAKPKKD